MLLGTGRAPSNRTAANICIDLSTWKTSLAEAAGDPSERNKNYATRADCMVLQSRSLLNRAQQTTELTKVLLRFHTFKSETRYHSFFRRIYYVLRVPFLRCSSSNNFLWVFLYYGS